MDGFQNVSGMFPGTGTESSRNGDGMKRLNGSPMRLRKSHERPGFIGVLLVSGSEFEAATRVVLEWTNDPVVTAMWHGFGDEFDFVDLDEDPSLGSPTTLAYTGDQYSYQFDTTVNETKTVYMRLRGQDETVVTSDTIGLDTQPPYRPDAPSDRVSSASIGERSLPGRRRPTWRPVPAWLVTISKSARGPGMADVLEAVVEAGDDPLIRFADGTLGQTLYARVRAIDRAGNASDWSAASDGIFLDRPPEVTALTTDPPEPRTLDRIEAVVTASDPDGDPVNHYQVEWRRDGELRATGPTLAPELTTRGEIWELGVRAVDRFGAESEASQHSFMIHNTPPSPPVVQIRPKPTQSSDELAFDVQIYSVDPDGDEVDYDLIWLKSTDGGATWVHKGELDGDARVSPLLTSEGDLWGVSYMPYDGCSPGITQSIAGITSIVSTVFPTFGQFAFSGYMDPFAGQCLGHSDAGRRQQRLDRRARPGDLLA